MEFSSPFPFPSLVITGSLVVVVCCVAQVSPNSKIPAIVDHDTADGEPQTVFESGAILLYLAQKTGQFFPTDARERVACLEWLFFQVREACRHDGNSNLDLKLKVGAD